MKNFVQRGDVLTLVAPYARTSGQAMKVGSIIAICAADADNGSAVEAAVEGVFMVEKVNAQAWATVGTAIYWDDAAKLFTTVSAGNTLAGVNVATATNPSATGKLRLNGSVIA